MRFTLEVIDVRDRLDAAAVTFLLPITPTNLRPVKVATPSDAFLTKVPVNSEAEPASEIEGFPVVTRFSS